MQAYTPKLPHETIREHAFTTEQGNPLHNEEGFLISHIEQVGDLGILTSQPITEPERTRYGTAFHDRYDMSNGIYYNVATIVPERTTTDIPLDIRTPWFTTEKGHNRRTAEAASALGMPVRLFGPPRIEVDRHPLRFISSVTGAIATAEAVSMDSDIAAYALISNHIDEVHHYTLEKGASMAYGESRGAMEGFGALSLSETYGRKLLWLEAVDACVPVELNVLRLVGNPKSAGELLAAVKTVRHLASEGRRLKYMPTIDLSLDYIIPAMATRKTLFSGRAGEFSKHIPTSSHGHGTFFDGSIANGYDSFKENVAHAEGFSTELLRGAHLTLAAREMIYRSLARIIAARDALHEHGEDFAMHDLDKIRSAKPFHKNKIKASSRAA